MYASRSQDLILVIKFTVKYTSFNRGSHYFRHGSTTQTYILSEQKKVEESKVKEKKVEERELPRLPVRIVKLYENNIAPLTPITLQGLDDWLNAMSEDVVEYAISEAVKNNKRNYKYIEAILRNHFNAGRTTLAEVQSAKRAYKGNENELSINRDDSLDYDELEKIMREKT